MPDDADLPVPLTHAELHILLALAGGEQHGYAVMQEISESTGGRFRIGPGTLYGTIKRLLRGRLIAEGKERVDKNLGDERRRYYRLTDSGRRALSAEVQRLAQIVAISRKKQVFHFPADVTA